MFTATNKLALSFNHLLFCAPSESNLVLLVPAQVTDGILLEKFVIVSFGQALLPWTYILASLPQEFMLLPQNCVIISIVFSRPLKMLNSMATRKKVLVDQGLVSGVSIHREKVISPCSPLLSVPLMRHQLLWRHGSWMLRNMYHRLLGGQGIVLPCLPPLLRCKLKLRIKIFISVLPSECHFVTQLTQRYLPYRNARNMSSPRMIMNKYFYNTRPFHTTDWQQLDSGLYLLNRDIQYCLAQNFTFYTLRQMDRGSSQNVNSQNLNFPKCQLLKFYILTEGTVYS